MSCSTPGAWPARFALATALACLAAGCGGDADFDRAAHSNTTMAWDDYLRAHPDDARAREARERRAVLVETREWQQAQSADNADAYRRYLRSYPQGAHANDALEAITHLNLASPPSAAASSEPEAAGANAATGAITRGTPVPSAHAPRPAAPGATAAPAPTATVEREAAQHTGAAATLAAAAASPPATAEDGFRVQLGAFGDGLPSAERAWREFAARHPDLAGRSPLIAVGHAANGHVVHRLQLAGFDRASAEALCTGLTARHEPCLVVPPVRTPAAPPRAVVAPPAARQNLT
jgi:hypothetical protein